ncbi:L-serine ammonia-lyase, iron-sulfur-dependent, subunit alpha [Vibrio lentus]|nr:L-serine ammonia-lyase, iron-sulfur-dependent, subunit alpha [Vibrio lentus]
MAEHFRSSQEQLARALIMSHLGAIYIKSYYPPLSAFCGNTVASAAAAMAMVYLAKVLSNRAVTQFRMY